MISMILYLVISELVIKFAPSHLFASRVQPYLLFSTIVTKIVMNAFENAIIMKT